MIIEALLNLIKLLLNVVFGWINIPQFPEGLTNSVDTFLSLVFDNLSLLGFFIRRETLMISIPLLIILLNFEQVYKLVMYIVRKIPFLGIK